MKAMRLLPFLAHGWCKLCCRFIPASSRIVFISGTFWKKNGWKCTLTLLHIMPRWSATGWGRRRFADGPSPVTPTTLRSALQNVSNELFWHQKSWWKSKKSHHFLDCPFRRTPMIVEELLLFLSPAHSSSPVSPFRHSFPDDGQLCCLTHSHTLKAM